MQAIEVLSLPPTGSSSNFCVMKMNEDLSAKLKISSGFDDKVEELRRKGEEDDGEVSALDEKSESKKLQDGEEVVGDEESGQEEEEFSFVCTNPDGSPISADDVFQNGQIRPMYPLFKRDLLFADHNDADCNASSLRLPLKKVFIEKRDKVSSSESDQLDEAEPGSYWEWSRKAVQASPELCQKSNSTGFSKLWRFRDLIHRSHSDGKDAFVFLNNPSTSAAETITKPNKEKAEKTVETKKNDVKVKEKKTSLGKMKVKVGTASSAHEKHYVRNRANKEVTKRRSYLPYRQDLVGFFTNVNGLSRNVHPF